MTPVASRTERAFRACGVAPVGVFVLLHAFIYGSSALGRPVGDAEATRLEPWVVAVELALVGGPLAFHAVYGLFLLARRKGRIVVGPPRVLDRVQRASSLLVGLFVVDHYLRFRWPMISGAAVSGDARALLIRELSSTSSGLPLVAGFQLLGVAAVAFHLGYGLYRYEWPLTALADGRRRAWLAVSVGLLVLLVASLAVVELATGKKLVPSFG